MAFLILLSLLAISVLLQKRLSDTTNRKIYYSLLILLSVFLVLRYGQGTDYFNYKIIFNFLVNKKYTNIFSSEIHTEFGFKTLVFVFKILGLPFEVLIAVFGLFSMYFIHKGITKFVALKYSALSLLLLYPAIYLTYLFSGIRQGLVMTLFLGIMLPALLDKAYLRYYVVCFLGVSIHYSSFLFLFVPLVYLLDRNGFLFVFISSVLFLVLSSIFNLWEILYSKTGFIYFGFTGFSFWGALERIFMLGLIVLLLKGKENNHSFIQILFNIYFVGFCITLAFSEIPLLSHRITAPLKAIEILLIPALLEKKFTEKTDKRLIIIIIVLIVYSFVFTAKNINSYIFQQNYVNTNIINYPYISILNKESIFKFNPDLLTYSYFMHLY